MARHNGYGDDDYDDGSSHSSAASMSPEEMKRQADMMMQKNQSAIQNFQLSDEDMANILPGIKVPAPMRMWVQMALDGAKYYVLGKTDQLFTGAAKLASTVGIKNRRAQQIIGATAETGARVGIITFQQLLAVFRASRKLAAERQENFHRFEAIREATGADLHNNQMIALADQRAQAHWWADIKWIATDAPMLIALFVKGWGDQRRSFERWKNFKGFTPADTEAATRLQNEVQNEADRLMEEFKPELDKAELETKRHIAIQNKIEGIITKQRKEYIENYLRSDAGREERVLLESKRNERIQDSKRLNRWEPDPFTDEEFKGIVSDRFEQNVGNRVRSNLEKRLNGENVSEDNKETSLLSHMGYAGIAGTQILQATLGGKPAKETAVHAPEMIAHLSDEMKTYCDSRRGDCTLPPPGDIQITGIGHDQGTMSLRDYIIAVFQAHERDLNPKGKWEKRDKDGHVIGVVDPMAEPLVRKLEPAVELIADAISKGLSPEALVALVGSNDVIRHGLNGARSFASVEQVKAAIEKLKGPLGMHDSMTADEFLGRFEKPKEISDAIQKNLETMKDKSRGYFAGLLSDGILEHLKMKKKEIAALHKSVPKDMDAFLAANALYLDSKGEEHLKKIGLGEKDIQAIAEFAGQLKSGDMDAIEFASGGRSPVRGAIVAAGLLEQTKGGAKHYWGDRIKGIPEAHKAIEAAKQQRAENMSEEKERAASEQDPEYDVPVKSGEGNWRTRTQNERRDEVSEERVPEETEESRASEGAGDVDEKDSAPRRSWSSRALSKFGKGSDAFVKAAAPDPSKLGRTL